MLARRTLHTTQPAYTSGKPFVTLQVRTLPSSVADPDPGSGAFLTPGPGSGILNRFFSGSRIPTSYFLEVNDKFLGKKFYNSPLSFVAVFGSGIRDPGSGMGKNQDPG